MKVFFTLYSHCFAVQIYQSPRIRLKAHRVPFLLIPSQSFFSVSSYFPQHSPKLSRESVSFSAYDSSAFNSCKHSIAYISILERLFSRSLR